MGLLDRLKELAIPDQSLYRDMLSLEGDEFEKAASAVYGNIPNATSSNAHNKEMEMFLHKLFGKYMSADVASKDQLGNLFYEFGNKGYPLAQELIAGSESEVDPKIFWSQNLLDNPLATEEQKKQAGKTMNDGLQQFVNNIKDADSRVTSRDALLQELFKIDPNYIQPLDPKYLSSEQGQHFNKEIAPFMGRLYNRVNDKSSGLPTTLADESLKILEAFAKAGYPSAQEVMGMIAYDRDDKKALNHWAKQVEKNPFSTEEQKKNARDDVKDTQAFVAQSQARGGR